MKLSNGTEMPDPIYMTTMMAVRRVGRENPDMLGKLIIAAQDPSWPLNAETRTYLQSVGILKPSGEMHSAVRDIIMSEIVKDTQ